MPSLNSKIRLRMNIYRKLDMSEKGLSPRSPAPLTGLVGPEAVRDEPSRKPFSLITARRGIPQGGTSCSPLG